jgi:Icc-related predicted phosphoesterase
MRLWVVSDLHLDVNSSFPLILPQPFPEHDVVVIAGDICEGMADGVRWIAQSGLTQRPVLYVGGNHEFYGHDRFAEVIAARAAAVSHPNIHVLEGDQITIGSKTFFGATLWTDYDVLGDQAKAMNLAERYMSDHNMIRNGPRKWTASDALAEHTARVGWLETGLASCDKASTVVVSHHAPSPRSCSSKFRGHPLNASFASDLEPLVAKAGTWIHGHTHTAVDYRIEGSRVVNNPRGYVRHEYTGYDEALIVEV